MNFLLKYIRLLIFAALAFSASHMQGQYDGEEFEVSLLTCEPGTETYSIYGHTAVRVCTRDGKEDVVFNYGVFSFEDEGFLWRFVMGKPEYTCIALPTSLFLEEYKTTGRAVRQQWLNLDEEEKIRLIAKMQDDATQRGWSYRYNILRDNCTSRVVRMLGEATEGGLVLPQDTVSTTFRKVIDSYADRHNPWLSFGINLLLGADVDTVITSVDEIAFPEYAERLLESSAFRSDDDSLRVAVSKSDVLLKSSSEGTTKSPSILNVVTPLTVSILILLISLLCSFFQWKGSQRPARIFDGAMMFLTGAMGVIVALLFFFSEHPSVDSNRLITLLNPLPLLWLPYKLWRDRRGLGDYYIPRVQWLMLIAFYVCTFVQSVPAAVMIIALALLVRTLTERNLSAENRTPWRLRLDAALAVVALAITIYKVFFR
ncbi:MAG: DUF4105 domain-containing protein [Alloprevotella sp.]|nr:DUF4105 domain-containing protein [Alloprevotella sp.]